MSEQSSKKQNKSKRLVIVLLLILLVLHYVFPVFITSGESMTSTVCDSDLVLGIRFFGNLNQGDIITGMQSDGDVTKQVIKRVIGLPGDHVIISNNKVYVNGAELHEDYLYEDMSTEDLNIVVPLDRVFVMGDNRNVSFDSRKAGCLEICTISSKVLFDISKGERCY